VALIVVGLFFNIVDDMNDAYMIVVGGSRRRRAPGIVIRSPPRTPEPDTDSETSVDDEVRDPSFDPTAIGSSQLVGAPLGTQETLPKQRGRRERADVGSQNVIDTQSGRVRKAKKIYTPNP
jgi:hypothetical protein